MNTEFKSGFANFFSLSLRNFGLIAAAVLAALWWAFPSAVLSVLDANQRFLLTVALMLPASMQKFISGFVEIVQGLQAAFSLPGRMMSPAVAAQYKATIAIVANALLLLAESKVLRWSYNVLWLLWKLSEKIADKLPARRHA